MDTSPAVLQLTKNAAEAIRELNQLTRFRDAFADPADLSRALAELTAVTSQLPQLLDQLQRWLRREHDAAPLHADTLDADADELVCLTTGRLTHASHSAHHLTTALDTAHQYVAHLATVDRHPE